MIPFRTGFAVRYLLAGDIVACATEGVWGLSCSPWHEETVDHLLALKSRPRHKGLILVAADMAQFSFLVDDLSASDKAQLELSWPGPTTWLVPHRQRVPDWIRGEHESVALRVSNHPAVRELCLAWGGPLVSTSANTSGAQAATEIHQLKRYFGHNLGYILPGRPGGRGRPSRIVDLVSGKVLRPD